MTFELIIGVAAAFLAFIYLLHALLRAEEL
jgi:hypothetical protein